MSDDIATNGLMTPSKAPLALARTLVDGLWRDDVGCPTLRYHRGGWYEWEGTHWREVIERDDLRPRLYRALEAVKLEESGMPIPAPDTSMVNKVVDAMPAIVGLPSESEPPMWLGVEIEHPADEYVPVRNGLFHLPTRQLAYTHSACHFNTYALEFDYDPEATCPEWERVLSEEVWANDPDSVKLLQEWFGYVVSGSTRLQKALLFIGPTRSFKGVASRVLTQLVGPRNVVGPSADQLAGSFGLWPLIGKPLAVVPDARFDRNTSRFIERVLAVVGNDRMDINRKHQSFWTGKLPTRIMILTNETPILPDASTTVVGRFELLETSVSFYGREDVDLEDRLLRELPGIFNWALAGWARLAANGAFTRPRTGADAQADMRRLASPVRAFVEDMCELGPEQRVDRDHLFHQYVNWRQMQGLRDTVDKGWFVRDLRSVCANMGQPVRSSRRAPDETGLRTTELVGLTLKDAPKEVRV